MLALELYQEPYMRKKYTSIPRIFDQIMRPLNDMLLLSDGTEGEWIVYENTLSSSWDSGTFACPWPTVSAFCLFLKDYRQSV